MLKGYSEYKDVGSNWINKIPIAWDFLPLQSQMKERKEKNDKKQTKFILSLTATLGVIPYSEKKSGGNKAKEDITKYNIAMENDLIVNCMNVVAGSSGISKYYGAISPVYYALYIRNENSNIKYWEYIFRNQKFYSSLVGLGNGILMKQSSSGKLNTVRKRIPMAKMNRVMLPVPSKPEQDKIVQFLDWKTSEMNRFIHQKKKQIKLLKELKLSIIDKAVTKGIDNVELKYSGHTWIGDIPKHWNMEYSKHFFFLRKDKASKGDEQLTSSQQYGIISQKKYMELENRRVTVVMTGDDILKHVEAGDFVISMRSFQGGIEYSTLNGKISSAYVMLIPNHKFVNDEYYKWLFKSQSYIKALQGTSDLVRDGQALRYSNFAKVYLPNIPLDEQQRIADYLNRKTPQIDKAISEINKEIILVEELRTKLISDVVTGQVDVRDVKIPTYETETDIIDSEDDSDEENLDESMEE